MIVVRESSRRNNSAFKSTAFAFFAAAVFFATGNLQARLMIVGNDEKTTWDEQGEQLFFPGRAKDSVCIVDSASDPLSPRIVATLPLDNSVYGPPTNLAINGKRVRKVNEIEVGGMPEGAVFSPDGEYLYVGNFLSRNISILKVDGRTIVDTGKTLELPGQPGAMRGPQ